MKSKQNQSSVALMKHTKGRVSSVKPLLHCLWLTTCNSSKMKFMMRAALGVWILSAVLCVETAEEQDTAGNSTAQKTALVFSSNKELGFNLYRKMASHADFQGKNIFFSPVSVSVALAALCVGAGGETHKQLFSGLGFNSSLLTQTDVDHAFRVLLSKSNEDSSEGTAVFVDSRFKPQPEFLDTLKNSYFGDGFNVDFTKPTDSINTINSYVAEKTKGKIDKLVENLDANTIMYLLSYIYYKGKWATPFDPELTRKDEFIVDENTKVPVQMMYMKKHVDVYYDQGLNTSVLHLSFNSSKSIVLLLPENMATLENAISPGHFTKWLKWMKSRRYEIYVPKFSIKTSYKLNNILTEMGMTDMFTDRADLSGIAPGQKLVVSEVVHQATLDLDESGATASGATGIGITLLSFQHTPVLKFNKAFMLAILDRNTQNILFTGKIINPNI
ncbi:serpin A3-6-like [Betta splendens]|uniref:Thyroxine-binding globulin n=1 Tax=Betta splendens TaxID=158456 RepID=A0A6P7NPG1_BETSP|nr:serpin A3-6-like [Betta splendens]